MTTDTRLLNGLQSADWNKRVDDAEKYIREIRNARKKVYASAYLKHVVVGSERPDSRAFGMSPMGAQAVWMSIDELFGASRKAGETIPRDNYDSRYDKCDQGDI